MNKTKTNYWIDVIIAIAFVLSATSGIVFLFPANGSSALGLSYQVWYQVHTWGSLLMIAGVLAHLALHWKWIVAMTKKTFLPPTTPRTAVAATAVDSSDLNRRQFLRVAGLGAVFLGTAMVGLNALTGRKENEGNQAQTSVDIETVQPAATTIPLQVLPSQSSGSSSASGAAPSRPGPPSRSSSPSRSSQTASVACPRGFTYDPYPGRCHHYVDRNGDGYCDYSIPAAA